MRQETGNNTAGISKELSIQIGLDGFSFSVSQGADFFQSLYYPHLDMKYAYGAEPKLGGDFSAVNIGWSTDMVLLVPAEVFDPQISQSYMEAANMASPGCATMHHLDAGSSIVAVWQADEQLLQLLGELYPQATHSHFLLAGIDAPHRDTVEVIIQREVAHIKVYNSRGLFAAETAKYASLEDILYFVKRLSGADSFAQYTLNLIAPGMPDAAEFFARYYRRIELCELQGLL